MNYIFEQAKVIEQIIKVDFGKECFIENSFKNYIKINDKYDIQNYPIPVVVVKDEFDIGLNLDGLFIEKFFKKNKIEQIDIIKLQLLFDIVELYGNENCMIDYYISGDSIGNIMEKINNSNEKEIGLAVYIAYDNLERLEIAEMIRAFQNCYI